MFQEKEDGKTHSFGDGCNDPHGRCTCNIEDAPSDIGHFEGCLALKEKTPLLG